MTERPDIAWDGGNDRPKVLANQVVPAGRRAQVPARADRASPTSTASPSVRRVASVGGKRRAAGRGDGEFHPRTIAIDDMPRSPISWRVSAALLALLVTAVTWATFSRIASYTTALGKIQATGRSKVVEALATGKVLVIRAKDGDAVESGGVLVELDPTDATTVRNVVKLKLTDLRAERQRAQVEIVAARAESVDPTTKIAWDTDIPAAVQTREASVARADLAKLAAQIATLRSRKHEKEAERDTFVKSIEAQKALVAITQENLTMIESLMKQGFNSQAKYLDMKATLDGQQVAQSGFEGSLDRAKQAILMVDSDIARAREAFVATLTQAIATDEQAIVDFTQQLVKAEKLLAYMTLRAPVAGIVHAAAVTTIGQVVKPGQQLMQIVPRNAPLEIEAYVANSDIGFIRKGDPASVKVDAFTYNVYGSLDATVTSISADALQLQGKATVQTSSLDGSYATLTNADKTGNLQYPVTLRATRSTIRVEGKDIPLMPGMGVQVEIETENRRAIDYILSPIEELFSTAGHER